MRFKRMLCLVLTLMQTAGMLAQLANAQVARRRPVPGPQVANMQQGLQIKLSEGLPVTDQPAAAVNHAMAYRVDLTTALDELVQRRRVVRPDICMGTYLVVRVEQPQLEARRPGVDDEDAHLRPRC